MSAEMNNQETINAVEKSHEQPDAHADNIQPMATNGAAHEVMGDDGATEGSPKNKSKESENSSSTVDPNQDILSLIINNFSSFVLAVLPNNEARWMSETTTVRGVPWRIVVVLHSNPIVPLNQRTIDLYLQVAEEQSEGWRCEVNAVFYVLRNTAPENIMHTVKQLKFTANERSWGFGSISNVEELYKGYINKDTLTAFVHVELSRISMDSAKETNSSTMNGEATATDCNKSNGIQETESAGPFVGLKNVTQTCYLNSALQNLFFINRLRKAVYQIAQSPDENPDSSVALALQRVFYDLAHSDKPVDTTRLMTALRWGQQAVGQQQDVHEANEKLLQALDRRMKGTQDEELMSSLFKGMSYTYVKCTQIAMESTKDVVFSDVQLNIRSRDPTRRHIPFTIMDSFREYIAPERLETLYDAGELGRQPAVKGTRFVHFPPILQIQLVRFEYDANLGHIKLNDRFEFTEKLNLNEFVGSDERIDYSYCLYSVIVHNAGFEGNCGHYVVFINTGLKERTDDWIKFDDIVVSRSSFQEAVVDNFGGAQGELANISPSAYMLAYIREDRIDEILRDVTDENIPNSLIERIKAEKAVEAMEEQKRKDAELNQQLYFLTDEVIGSHRGFDLFAVNALDTLQIHHKIPKADPLVNLFQYVRENVIGGENREDMPFRLWKFTERSLIIKKIPTLARFRATDPIQCNAETSMVQIVDYLNCERAIIYIEKPTPRHDGTYILSPYEDGKDILIFLKYFDNGTNKLRPIGSVLVGVNSSISDMLQNHPFIFEKANLPVGTALDFHEEISPEFIGKIESSYQSLPFGDDRVLIEMVDGPILIFERRASATSTNNAKTVLNKICDMVNLELLENDNSICPIVPIFTDNVPLKATVTTNLILSCDDLTRYMGKRFGRDPRSIVLWKSKKPTEMVTAKELSTLKIGDILSFDGKYDRRKQKKYKIFFNWIRFFLRDFHLKQPMRVTMMFTKFRCVETPILPYEDGWVKSILCQTRYEFKFSRPYYDEGNMRLVMVGTTRTNRRVMFIFNVREIVGAVLHSISRGGLMLRVEEIPPNQMKVRENEFLLSVAHYDTQPDRMFGVPFWMKVTEGELYTNVRNRIKWRSYLTMEQIEKYKFALVCRGIVIREISMEGDEVVRISELRYNESENIRGIVNQVWLGMDHPEPSNEEREEERREDRN